MNRAAASFRLIGLLAGALLAGLLVAYGVTKEVPVSGIEGMAIMSENGNPLPGATVVVSKYDPTEDTPVEDREAPRHYPQPGEDDYFEPRVTKVGKDGTFRVRNLPIGLYTIEISAKAHNFRMKKVSIVEGKPAFIEAKLEQAEPYLDIYASQRVVMPSEAGRLDVRGFSPSNEFNITVYKLKIDQIVKVRGLENLLRSFGSYAAPDAVSRDDASTVVRTDKYPVKGRDIEGTFVNQMKMPQLPQGFYWIECNLGKLHRGTFLNVTNMAIIVKNVDKQLVCFATDIQTGKPISGVAIQAADGENMVPKGKTDRAGLLQTQLTTATQDRGFLLGVKGSSTAVVDYYGGGGESANQTRMFVYSERPVYRPGDEVHFKGIARTLSGSQYKIPTPAPVDVEIRDGTDTLIENQKLEMSSAGTFSGSFKINSEAEPGDFTVSCFFHGKQQQLGIGVADYRKPTFSIDISPEKPRYTIGDRARAIVKCSYYFGGPVVGAKVKATVLRSIDYHYADQDADDGEEYEDGEYGGGGGGEYFEEITATTDAKGEAVIEFDTALPNDADVSPADYTYTVSASVADYSNKEFEGSGDVSVTQGTFQLTSEQSNYFIDPETPVTFTAFAKDQETEKPVAGRPVTITYGLEKWVDKKSQFQPEGTVQGETGKDGKVDLTIKPKTPGDYRIDIKSTDAEGHTIQSQAYLYVDGEGYGESRGKGTFSVTLDKKKYKIGDTCLALIRTSDPGGTALLTIEADKVFKTQTILLKGKSTLVKLPITEDYSPNVSVSVCTVKDKRFFENSHRIVLDDERKKLHIDVTADKDVYLPGDTATYTVKTTDKDGQPVPSDVSLSVVDESVYAIREDDLQIENAFYPKREDSVRTSYSFPEIYLDGGDKGQGQIPVRRKFRDTAFWQPTIRTDKEGEATVKVPLPENLTQWRATAVGVTDDTKVGTSTMQVRASKPLTVRLETPTFLVQGDQVHFVAMVQNDTGADADVNIDLQAQGIKVDGALKRTIRVPVGAPQAVDWAFDADTAGTATLVAKVWTANGASDGVEQKIDVQPHARLVVDGDAGSIKGKTTFQLNVNPAADPNTGRLLVKISPSLGQVMFQSLDELINYPYGCTEQTMSRFLPAVLVQQALKGAPSPNPELTAQIPQIAQNSLVRLQRMQHGDGSWGWWEYDTADSFMTAYVLDGLNRAKAGGYNASPDMIKKAVEWGKKQLAQPLPTEPDYKRLSERRARLYLAYAVAIHGAPEAAKKALATIPLEKAKATELAYAALAYHAIGDEPNHQKMLARLRATAVVTGQVVRWPEEWFSWGSEPTGVALTAIADADPKDPIIPKIVRYLMASRRTSGWSSTRETANILTGLSMYVQATGEAAPASQVSLTVNGKLIKTFAMGGVAAPDLLVSIPMSELKKGVNTVVLESGTGSAYYAADLRQYVHEQVLQPKTPATGLQITREFFLLEPRRLEDGTQRLMASDRPVSQAKSGDIVQCTVTVTSDRDREFVMVEVPVPSNCHVTDQDEPVSVQDWGWWYSRMVIRQDRVAFFARYFDKGKQILTFNMRAEQPGNGHAMPVSAGNMYDPTDQSSSGEAPIEVKK